MTEQMRIDNAGLINIPGLAASSTVSTDGSKNLTTSSDSSKKVSDGLIPDGALEKIQQLTPRFFKWKTDIANGIDSRQLGFYAQEVRGVVPEAAPYSDIYERLPVYEKMPVYEQIPQYEQIAITDSSGTITGYTDGPVTGYTDGPIQGYIDTITGHTDGSVIGKNWGFNDRALLATTIKALQESATQIETLRAQVAALETRVTTLEQGN